MKRSNSLPIGSWLCFIVFIALIYFVSSIDGKALGMSILEKFSLDKVAHFIEYGILTFLMMRAVRSSFPRLGLPGASILAVVFVIAFAAFDERHQITTPNRTCSFGDFVADFIGSSACILALVYREEDKGDANKGSHNILTGEI